MTHPRGIVTMKITCAAFVLLFQILRCLASDDSPFQLTNKDTGFCLVKRHDHCYTIRWTTGDRIMVNRLNKCLGVQGKSVESEISLYDCDEKSDLQKWECKNGTVLALKDQQLYIELTADNTAVLSKTIGPNNHLTISGTSNGACTRTYRELYTIEGNANGRPCMFPFQYKDHWYSDCIKLDSSNKRPWCAVQTKFDHELWGFCPTSSKEYWNKHITTGAYYQLNTQSALTWPQAEASCKQQGASLLSITDPHEQAYITALLGKGGRGQGDKLWTGLIQNQEHGWHWSNGGPYRYLNWDSGHPVSHPGHNCAIVNGDVQYSWQSSTCTKKLGYICYSEGPQVPPTQATETGFCSSPWIPYNGHCFHLNRAQKKWSDAQKECRKEGGDLVSMRNVEDQSFVISQLGFASTDELWIGLNDRKTEGLFEWTDHSNVRFTSWEVGEPAVFSDKENCVLIRGQNGNWADRECEEKHGFICMKMSESEPSADEEEQNRGCKKGWKKHGSYCYFLGPETETFDEAKDVCKTSDSYLADVSHGVDNAFLVSLVGLRPEKYFWLGLSNQKNVDHFVWTNTDSVKFTHWNAEMPGHQQGCVAMATGIFAGLWDVLPCTNKEKYICKHLAEGEALTPAPVTVAPPKCADGWSPVSSRNLCYKLFSESSSKKRTWFEARDYCRAIGGDLLSIHSRTDLVIGYRRSETAWIGLSAPDPVTGYVWSDGSPVNFQQWGDGQPDNKNNVESCAEFITHYYHLSGSWNDVQCEKYNSWLCQIRAGTTPKPPPDPVTTDINKTSDGWLEWNGTQYYINKKAMAMEEARHFCQQRHGDLVTINNEAERVFLWKQIFKSDGFYWIGLTIDFDETFEWIDGSPVLFQRWNKGQPDFQNYDENCAATSCYEGFWHDFNCGKEFQSICKRSSSPPANTTAAPALPPKGGCPPFWKQFNSKCYSIINNQKLTWNEARKQCQALGGNLASITSRHVEVFLISEMASAPTTDLWIGFRSSYYQEFYWTDGQPRKYINMHFIREYRLFWEYHFWTPKIFGESNQLQCAVINTKLPRYLGKWIKKSCNDLNGFVCHRSVDPLFPISPEPTTSANYFKLLNDSIKAVTQQMSWGRAKKNCENDGAKLASLTNEWLQAYVELLAMNLKTPLWIGLNKEQTNGYFRFIDGWQLTLSHWGNNEPSRNRSCVYVDVDGKWKTADCEQSMNSVCMKSTDVPPTESSIFPGVCPEGTSNTGQNYFWIPFQDYCYIFFTESRMWGDASASCVRHGGSLASIKDPSQQEFIQSTAKAFEDSHSAFWIGLFKSHKGEWLWLDKTVMDYTNWAEDQPDGRTHGGIRTSDGTWSAGHQMYYRPYICQTPKVILPKPSSSSSVVNLVGTHGHIALATVGAIAVIAMGAIMAFFLYKKYADRLPIPDKLTAFDNPLFFSNDRSQPDVLDTKKLVENEEEGSAEPVLTVI